jgi:hypothetical protein
MYPCAKTHIIPRSIIRWPLPYNALFTGNTNTDGFCTCICNHNYWSPKDRWHKSVITTLRVPSFIDNIGIQVTM